MILFSKKYTKKLLYSKCLWYIDNIKTYGQREQQIALFKYYLGLYWMSRTSGEYPKNQKILTKWREEKLFLIIPIESCLTKTIRKYLVLYII